MRMMRLSDERRMTVVLEQAFKGPNTLDTLLARQDVTQRADYELAQVVIQCDDNCADLRLIDRLVRAAPECMGSKFVTAQLLLEPAKAIESPELTDIRAAWRRIVSRTPELQVLGQVAIAA